MMFAVFPDWYATMFSGFYLPLTLIVIGLILRGISFEYRSKDARPAWRSRFDWMIAVGSFLASLLFGIVFTDLLGGLPIDHTMTYTGGPFSWLSLYGLIGGLTMFSVFLLHGANFLTIKLEDDLRERARRAARSLVRFGSHHPGDVGHRDLSLFRYHDQHWDRSRHFPDRFRSSAVGVDLFHQPPDGRLGLRHERLDDHPDPGSLFHPHVPAGHDLKHQPGLEPDHL